MTLELKRELWWSQGFVGLPLGPDDGSFWGRKTVWFRAEDPVVAFWEMLSFLSWVAKRCPHMVVTEVDEESGTVTLGSGELLA